MIAWFHKTTALWSSLRVRLDSLKLLADWVFQCSSLERSEQEAALQWVQTFYARKRSRSSRAKLSQGR